MNKAILLIAAISISMGAAAKTQRSTAELRAFQRETPCPANGARRGPCPGYQTDHIEPLCAGGVDRRDNMQWLTTQEHKWKTRTDVRVCRGLRKHSIDGTVPVISG